MQGFRAYSMRIGLKTYTDEAGLKYAKEAARHCDFIEILVVPDNDLYKSFGEIEAPIEIHCAHQLFGANPADKEKHARTRECILKAIEAADLFGSRHIVVHPGSTKMANESYETSLEFLKEFREKRFRVENLPAGNNNLGAVPEEIGKMAKMLDCGICFDFGHAMQAARKLSIPWKEHILDFMKLKPDYFHLCNGFAEKNVDHRYLSEGSYDIELFKSLIPKNATVTLETPHEIAKNIEDIAFLKK